MTLAELAIHIPASIELFEKYNFNYYQNGSQKFKDACEEKGLIFSEIDAELNQLQKLSKTNTMLTLEDMSVDRLIDFINGQHHANESEILNSIYEKIKYLINVGHKNQLTQLILKEVELKFNDLKSKLLKHCDNEDKIIFPHMRKLYELRHDKKSIHELNLNTKIEKTLELLGSEHIQAIRLLSDIKKITDNFSIQNSVSKEYEQLMMALKDFSFDFHLHLHIENNILFPKFLELEEELSEKNGINI